LVVNGDFEKVVDGKPEGWKGLEWVTAEKEDNNTFVRFVQAVNNDGTVNRKACEQDVEVPKGAKTLTFAARIRTKNCVPPKNAGGPSIWITYISQQGKGLSQISQTWGGKNGSWKTIQNEGPVPKDAAIAHVALINGRCPGQIDFDDIEVTFK